METLNEILDAVHKDPNLIRDNYRVSVVERGDFVLLNYKAQAQYVGEWNFVERTSRGLIINRRTKEIVARPFDKFFNWNERGFQSDSAIVRIDEKMDGSLGILYREAGEHKIATRGAFESPQAQWATAHLAANYDLRSVPSELTLLFEIIYPENRVILDYGNARKLTLLDARNRFDGSYLTASEVDEIAEQLGLTRPQRLEGVTLEDLRRMQSETTTEEGWVALFEDGQRFKFKSTWYIDLHKRIHGFSKKSVWRSIQDDRFSELVDCIPDEFLCDVSRWKAEIESEYAEVEKVVSNIIEALPPEADRKTLADIVLSHHRRYAPIVFWVLDGRPISESIRAKWNVDVD